MTQSMKSPFALTGTLASLLAAGVLVGCGGGGGSTPTTAPATPVAPTALAASLVTSVPAANYTGEAAAAFALLNAERNNCGFGMLAQNAALDAAATAHADYAVINGSAAGPHTEVASQPGFTGANPTDRMIAKGYAGNRSTTSEAMTFGTGTTVIRNLLGAPYHLNDLMRGYRDVGMVFRNLSLPLFVANFGYLPVTGAQMLASDDIKTYPCNGSTGVNFQVRGETPNPIPGRNLGVNPIGTPIKIAVREGNVLTITNAGMIKASTGAVISLRAPVTAANDPLKVNGISYFGSNEAYVAPDAPLERLTQYTVTYSGTNNGVVFTNRTFSFTTGNGFN